MSLVVLKSRRKMINLIVKFEYHSELLQDILPIQSTVTRLKIWKYQNKSQTFLFEFQVHISLEK